MPSSHPGRKVRLSRGVYAQGHFGDWTSGGIHAMTLDGLRTKLTRRDQKQAEAKAKHDRRRGDSKPDSASGTGRKWFT